MSNIYASYYLRKLDRRRRRKFEMADVRFVLFSAVTAEEEVFGSREQRPIRAFGLAATVPTAPEIRQLAPIPK